MCEMLDSLNRMPIGAYPALHEAGAGVGATNAHTPRAAYASGGFG